MSKHLDLGCGAVPRNPYRRQQLFGVDITPARTEAAEVRRANLAVEPIPFDDGTFDSVSAFDFLEHMPRILALANGSGTRFPFIELMNEISRVLRPGGLFYAVTPCYPDPAAFTDPTHVNFMTLKTCSYFTGDTPRARMYGFTGHFAAQRVEWGVHKDSLDPLASLTLSQKFRRVVRRLKGTFGHVVWELESTKPGA